MPTKFEIYSQGKRVMDFTPVAAMAIGPESVPIPGEVVFRDGYLILTRNEEHPAGVGLLWDLGELGTYHLETTRLLPREKPYNLNVELARCRLMKIVQKQEDWNLFDFPRTERYMQRFREAQALFADALGKLHEPAEAARLADQSLAMAVDLSDQLALFHADLLLARRRATNTLPKHIIGCRVDSTVLNSKYKDTLADNFDYAVLPMSWKQLQPEEGSFHAEPVDEWVDFLTRKRMPIIAGPLIDLTDGEVPDWMFIWEHDFDSLREMAYEYVQKVVHRYRKQISVWNVVSGLHTNSAFTLSFEQIIELTRLLVAQVKTIQPNARTLVTVTQPYGEYHARGATSVPPMLYAEMVAQAGINFEAFGLEIEQGVPVRGGYVRDLFQISSLLDRFSSIGRPVFLTALGSPGRHAPDPSDRSEGKLDPAAAGRWKRPWDQNLQAEWIDVLYKLALSKPFVESVAWGNLADVNTSIPAGGLLDDMLRPKPAFLKLQELRETLRGRKP
ncbi:endo-1,4-beta-xylanase [Fontivita pretiosa]|uniref:endo-1,4-beta-xylanase n=1 Tax=Fontivita pretiosa TaxID=2989684 RepID=UPI003D178CCC